MSTISKIHRTTRLYCDNRPQAAFSTRKHCFVVLLVSLLLPGMAGAATGTVAGSRGVVASAHPLASDAGVDILDAGGNAIDAAVATALVLAVVEPYSSGLGGGGFAVIYEPSDQSARALDFREKAPRHATRDMYMRHASAVPELSRTGALAVATPGLIAGLAVLHSDGGGRLPWAKLVLPAEQLARHGFTVTGLLEERIAGSTHRFNDAAQRIFAPRGEGLMRGATLVQRDLAATLAQVRRHGRKGFYEGPIAERLAAAVQKGGGILTPEDLAEYEPIWRAPIRVRYRDFEIISMPPPSSGGVHLAQMLGILAHYDLRTMGYGSASAAHVLIEAMKFAYADRARYLGDPDFAAVPTEELLRKERIDGWANRISLDHALDPQAISPDLPLVEESNDTTHVSIIDADGRAVSATLTINLLFGSGWVADGTGVVLNDEMDDFSASPGVPNAFGLVGGAANAIAPYKRPLSSMTPTIGLRSGEVFAVVGAPGGSRIITTVLQILVHLIDFEMDAASAVRAPRIHHQWQPREVFAESLALSPETRTLLAQKGHHIVTVEPMCNAQLVTHGASSGQTGASDWRGEGEPRAQLDAGPRPRGPTSR